MSLNQIIEFAQNKDNNALQIAVASVYIHGIKSGDPSRMNLILDRTYGKLKETHEHQIVGSMHSAVVDMIIQIEKDNKNGGTNNGETSEKSNEETNKKTTKEIVS